MTINNKMTQNGHMNGNYNQPGVASSSTTSYNGTNGSNDGTINTPSTPSSTVVNVNHHRNSNKNNDEESSIVLKFLSDSLTKISHVSSHDNDNGQHHDHHHHPRSDQMEHLQPTTNITTDDKTTPLMSHLQNYTPIHPPIKNYSSTDDADTPIIITPPNDDTPTLATAKIINRKRFPPQQRQSSKQRTGDDYYDRRLRSAVAYLNDYDQSRPPTLPLPAAEGDVVVSRRHLTIHRFRFSSFWSIVLTVATMGLFWGSALEGGFAAHPCEEGGGWRRMTILGLTFFAMGVYGCDMAMMAYLGDFGSWDAIVGYWVAGPAGGGGGGRCGRASIRLSDLTEVRSGGGGGGIQQSQRPNDVRLSRMAHWSLPLIIFLIALSIESVTTLTSSSSSSGVVIWMGALKPMVFFYISSKARNALGALNRVISLVPLTLIMVELFLIFIFATLAKDMYGSGMGIESFGSVAAAFVNLFELSTTVVNPSLWMPVYEKSRSSALFFVVFMVMILFYLHSLVLSVVFNAYMQAMKEIREVGLSDKQTCIRLAFEVLHKAERTITDEEADSPPKNIHSCKISTKCVRRTLKLMRPHYNRLKINALVDKIDQSRSGFVTYADFRSKIPTVLNTSIRTERTPDHYSTLLEYAATFVTVTNFLIVVMRSTSSRRGEDGDGLFFVGGGIVTILGLMEVILRVNPGKVFPIVPLVGTSGVFDGVAGIAAGVSLIGLMIQSTQILLIGRAMDMIRCLRYSPSARQIAKRSGEVIPALSGPLVLVISAVHIFTYIGMAIWGGSVVVGSNYDFVEPLYDLNNFNDYLSGLLTMFQVLVVNDWHEVAKVFINLEDEGVLGNRLVYPFFMTANIFNVSILLNVLTAFFVGAFVTKNESDRQTDNKHRIKQTNSPSALVDMFAASASLRSLPELPSTTANNHDDDDISSATSSSNDSIASSGLFGMLSSSLHGNSMHGGSTHGSNSGRLSVSKRQNYDKIVRTITGNESFDEDEQDNDYHDYYGRSSESNHPAAKMCQLLETFESLSPKGGSVCLLGYLVTCEQSMSRFGNVRFRTMMAQCMDDATMHSVISEMHLDLTVSAAGAESEDEDGEDREEEGQSPRRAYRTFRKLKHSGDEDVGKEGGGGGIGLMASLIGRSSLALFVARELPSV